jgi:alpha-glucoside transport system substrate-binding protein
VKAIATTRFQDGGLPILEGKCYMHRQANFLKSNFPAGTTFGDEGQVSAFYLPVAKAGDPAVMLGGGDIASATNDKPETIDTIRELASIEWANATAANMGNFSPRTNYDTSLLPDKFDKKFADIGKEAKVFRFDASDLMPAAVGSGSFWKEATSWITGGSSDDFVNNVQKSWPTS